MTTMRKFGFERVFSPSGEVLRDGEAHRTIFTQAEVDALCAQARRDGEASAVAEAQRAAAAAAGVLAKQAQLLLARLHEESVLLRGEALELSLAVGKALAGSALQHFGEDRALELARETMEQLRAAPRLTARVDPDCFDTLAPRLQAAAEDAGLGAMLQVRPDPQARPGDITLEWAEGRVGVSLRELESRLDAIAHDLAATLGEQP